jgi:formate hydrogenlyase subunit 6/NADH:ubiquinone oxidoreductase subunit I
MDLGMTSKNTKKRLYIPRFDIDIAKCCYCGLCVWPCPTECIVMTDVYEFSEYDRQNLIYSFNNMTAEEITAAQERLDKYNEEQAAKKAAAAVSQESPVPSISAAPVTPPPIKPEPPAAEPNKS